jgi:hypothetical protein
MKGMELSTEDQIVEPIATISRGVTFDRLQSMFQEWMQRLNWVIENNGEYYFEETMVMQNQTRNGGNNPEVS